MADAFEGLSGFQRIVDNIIIYDKDEASHMSHIREFLQHCKERNVALNRDKCKFNRRQITFMGLKLSSQGYQFDSAVTDTITKFPTLSTCTDL